MPAALCLLATEPVVASDLVGNGNGLSVAANETSSLSGTVTDKADGSVLIGVSVYIPELKTGTTTDINGRYSLARLPRKKLTLQVSYVGHQTVIRTVDLTSDTRLDLQLSESNAAISEVVVTGVAGSSLLKDSPSPVSVVTSRELLMQPSTNIIDALAHQPGVSQVTTGSGISKPVIRGLGYNRVAIVNDGIRQEGQQWGDEHGVEIDEQTVSSVEILKGPASLMYGSDAMAGVLVMHGMPVMPQGQMSATVSTQYQTNNGLFNYSLAFGGNKRGTLWNIRYSDKMAHAYKNKYDGYVFNSGFRERALTGMLGLSRDWGYSHLKLSYYHLTPGIVEGERDEQTGLFLKPVAVDGAEEEVTASRSDMKSYGHFLPYQQIHHYKAVLDNSVAVGEGNLKVLLAYQQNRRQELEDVLEPNECGLDLMLHTVNYNLNYRQGNTDGWQWTAGTGGQMQRSVNKGTEFLVPSYKSAGIGLYATAMRQLGAFDVSGGLRYDYTHLSSDKLLDEGEERFSSFSRSFNALTGSVGAVLKLSDEANLRLNLSRGYRQPNISELGANGVHEGTSRYEIGNKDLKPEASWQLDLGADYSSNIVSVRAALFASRIDNYIFYERKTDADGNAVITDGVPTYRYTSGDARLLGAEAWLHVHPVEPLHWENAFSYVNAVQLHKSGGEKYLPYIPAAKITSDIRYDLVRDGRFLDNTYVSFGVECNLRQSKCFRAYGTETPTPSYTLLNISAGTDIKWGGKKRMTLVVCGSNLTDKAYQSHLSRLKYTAANNMTGRTGVYNMGRNITVKAVLPIEF